jgi:hypothetical protein
MQLAIAPKCADPEIFLTNPDPHQDPDLGGQLIKLRIQPAPDPSYTLVCGH